MKRILTAIVLIPLVLGLVFRAPMWFLAAAIAVIALLAAREYLNVVAAYKIQPFRLITYFAVLVFCFTPVFSADLLIFWGFLASVPFLLLIASMVRPDLAESLPAAAVSSLGCIYIGFPFFSLLLARSRSGGWFSVLLVLLVVWSGDIFAYYIGRSFGRTPFAPRISPQKTWEGAIASFVGSILVALALFAHVNSIAHWAQAAGLLAAPEHFITPPPLWMQIAVAAAINVAAQLGDLVESMIKRGADIKDSGTLLPGHGGVLDRVDALLFAAPFAVLVSLLISSV